MNWSALVPDLLGEIATRIPSIEDFIAFRGVCNSWRASATKDKFSPSWPRIPLLMLAEKQGGNDEREFFSLSKNKICMRLFLPEARGKRCMEVRFGWLLTLTNSGDAALLNPFSGAQIQLPNFRTFPDYSNYWLDPEAYFIKQAVLSDNPSKVSNFTLLGIHCSGMYLGFWRSGDTEWTRIEPRLSIFTNVVHYKGAFYATDSSQHFWVWDGNVSRVLFSLRPRFIDPLKKMYLVESSSSSTSSKKEGKLQVIFRGDCNPPRDNYLYTTEFAVYQLDIVNRNWERISTLDGDTIFVGSNASMSISSVEAERSGIKSNCIYFTYHYITELGASERGGKDMGIYNMQDESVERFDGVVNQSLLSCLENQGPDSFVCPPLWIAPGN